MINNISEINQRLNDTITADSGSYTAPKGAYTRGVTYQHTVNFKKVFNNIPSVTITAIGVVAGGSTPCTATASNITRTGFVANITMPSHNQETYTFSWSAQAKV